MLEVFLFVNPLGIACQRAETAVAQLADELVTPVQVHFVPLLNFRIITDFMHAHRLDTSDLSRRNQLFETAYQIALDFKAAQFQGNKKARSLLLYEQALCHKNDLQYTPAFAEKSVKRFKLDAEAFASDREHEAMRSCFVSDQQIAQEMGITHTPSVVLFDNDHPDRDGLRLTSLPSYHHLKQVCQKLLTDPVLLPQNRVPRVL